MYRILCTLHRLGYLGGIHINQKQKTTVLTINGFRHSNSPISLYGMLKQFYFRLCCVSTVIEPYEKDPLTTIPTKLTIQCERSSWCAEHRHQKLKLIKKTHTHTHRIHWILSEKKKTPVKIINLYQNEHVLLVTFDLAIKFSKYNFLLIISILLIIPYKYYTFFIRMERRREISKVKWFRFDDLYTLRFYVFKFICKKCSRERDRERETAREWETRNISLGSWARQSMIGAKEKSA